MSITGLLGFLAFSAAVIGAAVLAFQGIRYAVAYLRLWRTQCRQWLSDKAPRWIDPPPHPDAPRPLLMFGKTDPRYYSPCYRKHWTKPDILGNRYPYIPATVESDRRRMGEAFAAALLVPIILFVIFSVLGAPLWALLLL